MADVKSKVTDASLKVSKVAAMREASIQGALDKLSVLTRDEYEEVFRRIPGIAGGMDPIFIPYYSLLKRFVDVNKLEPVIVANPVAGMHLADVNAVIPGIVGNPKGGMPGPHFHLGDNVYALSRSELVVLDAAFKQEFKVTLSEAASIAFK
jgi:hypothetical protein